jgi:ubiquinone/menaquinone biosynthesis C-methylase UbiE
MASSPAVRPPILRPLTRVFGRLRGAVLPDKESEAGSSGAPMRTRLVVGCVLLLTWIAYVGLAAEQLASRSTEEWIKTLDAPQRVASLKVDEVIARLKVSPGQSIADLGAGTGAFTISMAKTVGSNGAVYAVEIDRGLVDHVARKVADAKVTNVRTLLGKPEDPGLPGPVDLLFMNDVLHHVSDRAAYLKQVVRYLKPAGRFAVIDPTPEASPHRGEPALIVSRQQSAEWMKAAGLVEVENIPLFTDKWFVVYARK